MTFEQKLLLYVNTKLYYDVKAKKSPIFDLTLPSNLLQVSLVGVREIRDFLSLPVIMN